MSHFCWIVVPLLVSFAQVGSASAGEFAYKRIACAGAALTLVTGISESGIVVGTYIDPTGIGRIRGFLLDASGACLPLDMYGRTVVYDVNNGGQIVGESGQLDRSVPFLYQNGVFFELGSQIAANVPAPYQYCRASAMGINNRGQIVGTVHVVSPDLGETCTNQEGVDFGYIREPDGRTTVITIGPYESHSLEFNGINESGWVVGMSLKSYEASASRQENNSFLRSPSGTYIEVQYPGACETRLLGINPAGEAVGIFFVENEDGCNTPDNIFQGAGFYRAKDGTLSLLRYPGSTWTTAMKINASGWISGSFVDPGSVAMPGFIARKSTLF
ncbi:MAG: hypothetical protein KIT09_34780 [Bryobacteraceae bacterium]|nr:hypothetical protein [Bryobacteraceae bacterium]